MTNTRDTSKNNVLIIALVALAAVVIAAIVALAIFGSPDNAIVASATGQIVTLVTLIVGVLVTLKATTEAKVAAIESVAASKENAQSIAAVSVQTGYAIETVAQKQDTTNKLMNGHLSGLNAQIVALTQTIARLETDKAVKQVETAQIMAAVVAAAPSAVPPPVGSTPVMPMPPEAATIIVVDPPEAATITTVPPKGKRPKVGDQQ